MPPVSGLQGWLFDLWLLWGWERDIMSVPSPYCWVDTGGSCPPGFWGNSSEDLYILQGLAATEEEKRPS